MPHAYTSHGELHGVIFTSTGSHWDRTACVLDWPPTGPAFKAWHASLSQATLVLTPLPRHHHQRDTQGEGNQGKKSKKQRKREEAEEQSGIEKKILEVAETTATATDAIQTTTESQEHQKIGIPLEGCTIELVRDGLQGRSEMVRRAPLLLSHSSWPLLDGDKKVFIFATDPAAKQEWLHALSYWCSTCLTDGDILEESTKAIEETYALFCSVMAQKSMLPFVQEKKLFSTAPFSSSTTQQGTIVTTGGVVSSSGGVNASGSNQLSSQGGGRGEDGKLVKRASWKRWNSKNRQQGQGGQGSAGEQEASKREEIEARARDVAGGNDVHRMDAFNGDDGSIDNGVVDVSHIVTAAAALQHEVRPAVHVEHVTAADIDDIIEMRWMQSRKVPVPPAPPKQERKASSGVGGGSGSNAPSTATSLTPSPSLSPVKVPPIGPVVYRKPPPPPQQQQSGAPLNDPLSSSLPSSAQASPTKVSHQQQRDQMNTNTNINQQSSQQQQLPQALSPRSQAAQSSRLPPNFPAPLLPFDFFINATATRTCFDLLRNPTFSEHVRARIQRQLSRMHTPDYVTSLEVVSVVPGCTAPTLSEFATVPQPGGCTAFPQLIFDMKYSGSFTVTIECKVDIRDVAAWSALDQAIDRIEGKKKRRSIDKKEKLGERELIGSDDEVDEDELLLDEDESYEEERLLHSSGSSSDGDGSGSGDETSPTTRDSPVHATEQPPKRRLLGQLRQKTAQKLRKLADSTAMRISNLPLRVSLTFSVLEGTMCVWIPPPPGDRLFWSFLSPPKLELKATPQIGQRLIKYAYHASRASAWIQARLELAFRKNLVFPCGGDIALPLLLPVWNPRAYDDLEGLDKEKEPSSASQQQQAGAGARQQQQKRGNANGNSSRPTVQVTRQENEVSRTVTRVPGEGSASGSAAAAPFVEFSLRSPRQQN
jgi:hypothetical protein